MIPCPRPSCADCGKQTHTLFAIVSAGGSRVARTYGPRTRSPRCRQCAHARIDALNARDDSSTPAHPGLEDAARGPGRPPKGEDKRQPVKVYLSPDEREKLHAEALAVGLRLSEYIRRKALL